MARRIEFKPPTDCICERPNTNVFCQCGFFMEGARVRSICVYHPQTFYLLDMDVCPRCNSTGKLQEVRAYNPQIDYMDSENRNPPKLESVSPEEKAPATEARKNFYKRSIRAVEMPVLSSLSTNQKRDKSHWWKGRKDGASFVKK